MRNVKGALRRVERRKTARLATPRTAVSGRTKNLNVKLRKCVLAPCLDGTGAEKGRVITSNSVYQT